MDDQERYQRYLAGREWGLRREAVRKRCGGICERCRRNRMSHVHHLTYIRKYNERPEDLQGLCVGCHEFIHGKSNHDPMKDFRTMKPMHFMQHLAALGCRFRLIKDFDLVDDGNALEVKITESLKAEYWQWVQHHFYGIRDILMMHTSIDDMIWRDNDDEFPEDDEDDDETEDEEEE